MGREWVGRCWKGLTLEACLTNALPFHAPYALTKDSPKQRRRQGFQPASLRKLLWAAPPWHGTPVASSREVNSGCGSLLKSRLPGSCMQSGGNN